MRRRCHLTAAIYIPKAKRFHATYHCEFNLFRRGLVGDADELRRRKLIPCRKCWVADGPGYIVPEHPEEWE